MKKEEGRQASSKFAELHEKIGEIVKERTAELQRMNEQLQREISERKQVEKELRESEQKFRQLAENIHLIFTLRTEDEMLYASPAYETITGRSLESFYENPDSFLEYIHPEDREKIRQIHHSEEVKTTGVVNTEYRIILPDGSIRWLQVKAVPVCNENGEVIRRAGFTEDITEYKQAMESLQQTKETIEAAEQVKSEIFTRMSHELCTPLDIILECVQILSTEHILPEKKDLAIKTIQQNGEHLLEVLTALIDQSKLETQERELKPVEFHLHNCVRTLVNIYQRKTSQSI